MTVTQAIRGQLRALDAILEQLDEAMAEIGTAEGDGRQILTALQGARLLVALDVTCQRLEAEAGIIANAVDPVGLVASDPPVDGAEYFEAGTLDEQGF